MLQIIASQLVGHTAHHASDHCQSAVSDFLVYSHTTQHTNSVHANAPALAQSTVSKLLALHSIIGYDTTSFLFGNGKVSVSKICRVQRSKHQMDILKTLPAPMIIGCLLGVDC
jgi:hypothetical protein